MALAVRAARPDDARAVAEIHVLGWQTAYAGLVPADHLAALSIDAREAQWRASIADGQPRLLVCTDGEEVLGWISFGASRDGDATPTTAEVWAFYVSPPHWGGGVGRALWNATHEHLQRDGFRDVWLWAFPENERAGRFYRSIGFAAQTASAKTFELGGATLNEIRYARSVGAAQPGEAGAASTPPRAVTTTCHCGQVRLSLPRPPEAITQCDCSICRRYGVLWAYYREAEVQIDAPPGATRAYRWGRRTLEFVRCARCGCITHWQRVRRSARSDRLGVNARLFSPEQIGPARLRRLDGAVTERYLDDTDDRSTTERPR